MMIHGWASRLWAGAAMLLLCSALVAMPGLAQDDEADRDYWVNRYQTLKADVVELRARVDMLDTNYTRAKRRNYPRGAELDELRSALEESRKELAEKEEAWENFDDEARRAGALPGWFRD